LTLQKTRENAQALFDEMIQQGKATNRYENDEMDQERYATPQEVPTESNSLFKEMAQRQESKRQYEDYGENQGNEPKRSKAKNT